MILGCPKRTQNRSRNKCQKRLDFGPSWAPFWGAFWPPRWLKPLLDFLLERPRAVQEYFFFGPGALQERSKRPPRGFQEASRRPRGSKRPPGSHFGPIWTPFWTPFGRILELIWNVFPSAPSGPIFDLFGVFLPCLLHACCFSSVAGIGGAAPCETRPPS